MTQRLYYTDAYTHSFRAKIKEIIPARDAQHDQVGLVLDQTYLYPTSGGQPYDFGDLAGFPLLDVIVRKEDGEVVHYVKCDDEGNWDVGNTIEGSVDWKRRFDHMQHHSGQHILSRAFIEKIGAETVGFHLGEVTCTIDIDRQTLAEGVLADVEALANEIILENRPIEVRFVTPAEAEALPLRKRPPIQGDKMRLVDITDFDLTACGGTHVARTGEIGLLKILRTEKRKNKLRIEFICGQRILRDYGHKHQVVLDLMKQASTRSELLGNAFAKQKEEIKQLGKRLKQVQRELMSYRADALGDRFEPVGHCHCLIELFDGDEFNVGELRQMASRLTEPENRVVLLGLTGQQPILLFTRSSDLDHHMGELLKYGLSYLSPSKSGGGGGPDLAQGGGFSAPKEEILAVLHKVREKIA